LKGGIYWESNTYAISPSGTGLEETVPVDGGRLEHGVVVEVVDNVKLEVVPLRELPHQRHSRIMQMPAHLLSGDERTINLPVGQGSRTSETIRADIAVGNGQGSSWTNPSEGNTSVDDSDEESKERARTSHWWLEKQRYQE
jgi:hypothetical protein